MKYLSVSLVCGMLAFQAFCEAHSPMNTPQTNSPSRLDWYLDARFGMFIHWGIYSIPAGDWNGKTVNAASEWILSRGKIPLEDYRKIAPQFNPQKFNAREWVKAAKDAGMKYIVITAKHHDGFAMYDSRCSSWDIMDATPFGRDPLRELNEACEEAGIRLGFYYSQSQDWINGGTVMDPLWDPNQVIDVERYYQEVCRPQVIELLSNYGPKTPAVFWWDTPNRFPRAYCEDLGQLVEEIRPDLVTNNRLGEGIRGDFETPECYIPASPFEGNWETCMTMNDSWGFKRSDNNWKTTRELIRQLYETVSKGGNYLLNVGPTSEGEFPPESLERLKEIGEWMRVNEAAIRGTVRGPFSGKQAYGYVTRKGNDFFIGVTDYPSDGKIVFPLLNTSVKATWLHNPEQALPVKADGQSVCVTLDPSGSERLIPVLRLSVAEEPRWGKIVEAILANLIPQPADGVLTLNAIDSEVKGAHIGHGRNIGWWSNTDSYPRWLIRLDRPGLYKVTLHHAVKDQHAGSTVELVAGEESLTGVIPSTGGYAYYKDFEMGTIRLSQAGEQFIELRLRKLVAEGVMNLKWIQLTPVSE